MKYVKPKSVTWWAGVALLFMGFILGIDYGYDIGPIGDILNAWTGNIGPSVLLAQGAGLIGLRAAITKQLGTR